MSGTSVDSVDAALVDLDAEGLPELRAVHSRSIPGRLRQQVLALFNDVALPPTQYGRLDVELGRLFASTALELVREAGVAAQDITAIGSHGQTVHHAPDGDHPFTLQLGDPNIIAETTGITTVADFRRRDIAAGGQGAPLAPAFHAAMLRSTSEARVVLNLGGLANATVLPRLHSNSRVTGFDTGPANCLLDAWADRHLGQSMDTNGAWARSGALSQPLLETLLADPFLCAEPPKSTGRERYNLDWLDSLLNSAGGAASGADVARTLTEFTAASVALAIERWAQNTSRVLACGGGARNAFLMERLAAQLAPRQLGRTDDVGMDPAWVECMAFAWLARETLARRPGNLLQVTGARREVILGAVYPGAAVA